VAPSSPSTTIAALNASTGTTTLVLVVTLIALGLAMVLTAVWLVRATRSDPPALAPLETLGTRRWRRAGADHRAVLLADARPAGAPDPAPTVPYGDDEPSPAPVVADAEPEPEAAAAAEREPEPRPAVDAEAPEVEEQAVATPESS
jgi:hypothetical protein